ncbi:MAG: ParB/RepB/Spo0J family partition protein [Lachnospiraceae bacterium]|nr:ParB/RepB/Spo0J family partition protein [Lachnospiraceae bacterium]
MKARNLTKSELEKLIADEVNIYADTRVIVKASMAERIFVKRVSCSKLHPNPDDEFSDPKIGPNYQIVSSYVQAIKHAELHGDEPWLDDPVIVEKSFPDGYLLLNGHHRWAACRMYGKKRIRTKIVNLTQQQDIEKMLKSTDYSKRAALDLEEVVFSDNEDLCEKPLKFLSGFSYKERLRLGIPALFRYLSSEGYDIWVYSNEYYSFDYLRHLFGKYHAGVTGVITGVGRKTKSFKETRLQREKLFESKYSETLHISIDNIVRTKRSGEEPEVYDIKDTDKGWYREAVDIVKGMTDPLPDDKKE